MRFDPFLEGPDDVPVVDDWLSGMFVRSSCQLQPGGEAHDVIPQGDTAVAVHWKMYSWELGCIVSSGMMTGMSGLYMSVQMPLNLNPKSQP